MENELQQLIDQANALNLKDEAAIGLEALITLNYDHGNFHGVHQHSLRAVETGRSANPTTTARMLAYILTCAAQIDLKSHFDKQVENNGIQLEIVRAEEALHIAQIINYPSDIALAWVILVRAAIALGDFPKAVEQFQTLQRQVGNCPLNARARNAIN
ncbi:hypothetical protein [Chlorogloeopsis fritschii]|uniref:hypothetical protein n=1 Tax=Chlorogloeopsis fritschii TaxID=1124 RepID=UPI0023F2E81C|nr:hypothetical protein [Chlorogloeopsis fritschii]